MQEELRVRALMQKYSMRRLQSLTKEGLNRILKKFGAKEVYALATHGVLSNPAIERISKSQLKEVVVTNTINIPREKRISKLKILSIAPLLAETIKRTHEGLPMGVVYEEMHKKLKRKIGKHE